MEVGWSLRWRVEGGRERSDWRGIFLFFLLDFCFVLFLGGSVGGVGSMGLCICIVWMRMGIMGVLLLLSSVIDVPALAGEVEAGWLFFRSFDWI